MRQACLMLVLALASARLFASTNFVNFETAPVHPVALSPDGQVLAVCNLPDGRVELFRLSNKGAAPAGSIPVGIDPVTVRFRTNSELWVVNTTSDSINVFDLSSNAVVRLISTRDGPADVVFAGNPQNAYVSCPPENVVLVINPISGATLRTIPIQAQRPKAMTASPDGLKVFVAILESGNGTTTLAPRITDLGHTPAAGPVDMPFGPYKGLNPPPNSGDKFEPALSTNWVSSSPAPRVGLIVKKQKGRWIDDNHGDWTEMVSGTNAPFSGRVPGWDLVDHDVAVIDTSGTNVTFIDSLMNICMDLSVDPLSGRLAVIGTDGLNHIRYEPVLQSIFTRVELALIDNDATPVVLDLNPHLNYRVRSIPKADRAQTVGDPRGVVWNATGTLLYVTGMGSDNVVMLDRAGNRLGFASVPEGPTGLIFDPQRNRLYVLSRFASILSVLDAENLSSIQELRLFDPSPTAIRKGRKHFYNTTKSSGLGQAACASCHVDGRFDRLAWDLGNPIGSIKNLSSTNNFGALPAVTNHFHPMKGPMVTQTLQDIIGHEPFHWRGDRNGLEEFNPTFKDLQGADAELTAEEMQEFENFLGTIAFPPNRFRQFDNSLPRSVPLAGHLALGRGQRERGEQLPNGDAVNGLAIFRSAGPDCAQCHTIPVGSGADKVFKNSRWNNLPVGPNGEHHLALAAIGRSGTLPFKIAQLRSIPEKIGFDSEGLSLAGFGFFHDGRVDSLVRFIQDGFVFRDDKQTADLIAFLLSFSGSDLPLTTNLTTVSIAPSVDSSRDAPAALGRQLLLSVDSTALTPFITRATVSTGRVDLIATARTGEIVRGWVYDPVAKRFLADRLGESVDRSGLFTNVSESSPLLFTLVPKGAGRRLAIDRDEDGALNFDELQAGADPADPTSVPGAAPKILAIALASGRFSFSWQGPANRAYRVLMQTNLAALTWQPLISDTTAGTTTTNAIALTPGLEHAYFQIELLPPP